MNIFIFSLADMSAFFGLHVGRTNACVAVCKDGKSDVVANDAGDRTTPAMVTFSEDEIVSNSLNCQSTFSHWRFQSVGLPAKQGLFRNTSNTAVRCKELLGVTDENAVEPKVSVCPLTVKNGKVCYEIEIDEKTKIISPEEVLEHVYAKLYDIAIHHSHSSGDSMKAVLSVPLSFTVEQRKAVWKAAEKTGFSVIQVISEPAAALLAYGIGQATKHDST